MLPKSATATVKWLLVLVLKKWVNSLLFNGDDCFRWGSGLLTSWEFLEHHFIMVRPVAKGAERVESSYVLAQTFLAGTGIFKIRLTPISLGMVGIF